MEEKAKLFGARQGVINMLFYYIDALVDAGDTDPLATIINELPYMLRNADLKMDFVRSELSKRPDLAETISLCIQLLEQAEKKTETDREALKIVRSTIENLNNILLRR